MFRGAYEYAVDDRGRVPIPRAYRSLFEQDAGMIVDGNEGCLEIYTRSDYDNRSREIEMIPATTEAGRRVHRAFYGTAREIPLDKQGRILVPASMRSAAEIEGEVVLVGRGNVLELWNKKRWESEYAIVKETYSQALAETSGGPA